MKRKVFILCAILGIQFIVAGLVMNPSVRAATYTADQKEGDSFVWEITELDVQSFERVFDIVPKFEEGYKTKILIKKMIDVSYGWSLTVERWNYIASRESFSRNGSIEYMSIHSDPTEYNEELFIPTPVEDYLEEAAETLPSEYLVDGKTVTRREQQDDFKLVKEYNGQGVCVSETYLDFDDNRVIIKVEGTFRAIPTGTWEPITFMMIAISGFIFFLMRRRKVLVKTV